MMDMLLIIAGILLGILLGVEMAIIIEKIINILEELVEVRKMDIGTGTVVGATPEEMKAIRLEEAKEKMIKIIEKQTGYKYDPESSDNYILGFHEDTGDDENCDTASIWFCEEHKCFYYNEDSHKEIGVTIELYKAIGDYMKELGWM